MREVTFLDGRVRLYAGDNREALPLIADCSIDSVVTDPPYALVSIVKRFGKEGSAEARSNGATGVYKRASSGFMGKKWDTGEVAFDPEFWAEVCRVLKPGGHVVAFGGTRSYHRLACAIEDAGFEIRDQIGWVYGSGFPKSHDVSKDLDKRAGHWRGRAGAITRVDQASKGTEYERSDKGSPITAAAAAAGWGTALKPAWEPIVLARKPLSGTVADNWLEHGTGALNIDSCRVGADGGTSKSASDIKSSTDSVGGYLNAQAGELNGKGRWPANICHDGSEEVLAAFPDAKAGGNIESSAPSDKTGTIFGQFKGRFDNTTYGDAGSAARFFYTAKADANDRIGSKHPTVKPVDLMRWLVRLVTPKGGTVLDPFAGTGTTAEAVFYEGCSAILIEREGEYVADIERRIGSQYCTSRTHLLTRKG